MKKEHGLTLIELMIVVTILALIAAFAYPSYQEQIRTSRRADCAGVIMSFGNAMERFYTVNNTYLGAATGGANTGGPAVFPTTCPVDGGTANYALTIQAATASTYTLAAAPVGPQAGDKCGSFTLTNVGLKGVAGAAAGITWEDCWR